MANFLSNQIIEAAIEVYRVSGPGLLESACEVCLCKELSLRSIDFQKQGPLPVAYKGEALECGYRLDLLVNNLVIIELKSVEGIIPIHEAQLLTYLRLKISGWVCLLILMFQF